MIEISNTFILVWLVVLAIICIYLLYMSMTRNNESDSLKSSIANLVRQNKKRDELINFLMERVETLTGVVNNLALPAPIIASNLDIDARPSQNKSEQIYPHDTQAQTEFNATESANTDTEIQNLDGELSLDDVLNFIHIGQPNYDPKPTGETADLKPTGEAADLKPTGEVADLKPTGEVADLKPTCEAADLKPTGETAVPETSRPITLTEVLEVSEFDQFTPLTTVQSLSPAKQAMSSLNLDDVLNSIPTTFKDDDLISTILGADDSASNHGDVNGHIHHDNSDFPAEKLKLRGMSVKQLKQIAKDMNIKSRGNKTELVDSIWEKTFALPTTGISDEQHIGAHELVSSDADMDALLNEDAAADTLPSSANISNPVTTQLLVEDFPDDI
jgi:hypothetical protein